MSFLLCEVLWQFLRFEYYIFRSDFTALRQKVRDCPRRAVAPDAGLTEKICGAVSAASVWYPKQVLCLQRSAAAVCVMKRHGLPAQLVIGAQLLPFKAHAWVELNHSPINDRPGVRQQYMVLDVVESGAFNHPQ